MSRYLLSKSQQHNGSIHKVTCKSLTNVHSEIYRSVLSLYFRINYYSNSSTSDFSVWNKREIWTIFKNEFSFDSVQRKCFFFNIFLVFCFTFRLFFSFCVYFAFAADTIMYTTTKLFHDWMVEGFMNVLISVFDMNFRC